ncbi:MAG: hypothetical protein JWP81_568 [Ferruginibacter sp.]|nr:hypothetical protein [Ferruginibacter sp.]
MFLLINTEPFEEIRKTNKYLQVPNTDHIQQALSNNLKRLLK